MSIPCRTLCFVAFLLLAGCTPMQWVRDDGASAADPQKDMAHCQQEAWRESRLRHWYHRPLSPVFLRDGQGRLVAWSRDPFLDPFGDPFMEESRLAHFCMRAKGYRLVPLDKPAAKGS